MRFVFILLLFPLLLSSVEFTVPFQAYDADVADIDNDGDLDIMIGSLVPGTPEPSDSVTFLINNGYGEFTKSIIPKNNFAYIKMIDIDCDGLLDICTKNSPNYQIVYYKNLGNLEFDEATIIPVEYTYVFQYPKFNDMDSDGDMDIVINYGGSVHTCNMLINIGDGTFIEENIISSYDDIRNFNVSDINSDGFGDILITTNHNPYLAINDNLNFILLEIDTMHWSKPYIFDMNNDHHNDIILNIDYPSLTKILYNDGTGIFFEEHLIEMPTGNILKDINDYNNDGYPDFAVQTDWEPPNVYICFNNGDGTITEPIPYTFGNVYSFVVRSSDFDGNGFNDLLVTAYYHSGNSHGASILFNDGFGNFVDEPQVGINNEELIINNCKLSNHPNPFTGETTISFSLNTNLHEKARIEIFNVKGQLVETFANHQITNSPNQQIIWNADNHASGVYFYKLVVDGKAVDTKKMILIK
jgi:hypothetical protein